MPQHVQWCVSVAPCVTFTNALPCSLELQFTQSPETNIGVSNSVASTAANAARELFFLPNEFYAHRTKNTIFESEDSSSPEWTPFSETDRMAVQTIVEAGGQFNLPCTLSGRDIYMRIRIPGTDLWSKAHGIPYFLFMDRVAYRKHKAEDIQWNYARDYDLSIKRGLQVKFQRAWHRNREIVFFSDYWVVNKSGIALNYETEPPRSKNKKDRKSNGRGGRSAAEDADDADDDSDTEQSESPSESKSYEVLKFTQTEFSDDLHRRFLGSSAVPLLMSCPRRRLRIMPYAMMSDIGKGDFFIYDVHCLSGKTYHTHNNLNVGGQAYQDEKWLITHIPESISTASKRYRTIYIEPHNSDKFSDPQEYKFVSFRVPKDSFVYLCVDARCATIPHWMTQLGFLSIGERFRTSDMSTVYHVYKKFYRGLDWVYLGGNKLYASTDSTGTGNPINMYIIIILEAPPGYNEPTVANVAVQANWFGIAGKKTYHVKPCFRYGDRLYSDSTETISELPTLLLHTSLLAVQTRQADRFNASFTLLTITLQHPSRVFLCVDVSINIALLPYWIKKCGFADSGMFLSSRHAKYRILHRSYGVEQCILGGMGCRESSQFNYFVLIADEGEFARRLSQFPVNSINLGRNRRSAVTADTHLDTSVLGMCKEDPTRDISHFWDQSQSQLTMQRPFFDEQGRHWSQFFDVAVGNKGELRTNCATFSISIQALPGVFHRTSVVSILPRFVIVNHLPVDVFLYPFCGTVSSRLDVDYAKEHCTKVASGASGVLYSFYKAADSHMQGLKRWLSLVCVGGAERGLSKLFSRPISIDDIGETHVWLPIRPSCGESDSDNKSNGYLVVSVSVMLDDTSVVVTLADASLFPPYRIENRTSTTVLVRQLQQEKWLHISPSTWCSYLLDDPYGQRFVELGVTATNAISAPYSLDEIGPLPNFDYSRTFFSSLVSSSSASRTLVMEHKKVLESDSAVDGSDGVIGGYVHADKATRVLVLFNYYDQRVPRHRQLSMGLQSSPLKQHGGLGPTSCIMDAEPNLQNMSTTDKLLRSLQVKVTLLGVAISIIADTSTQTLEELLAIYIEGVSLKFNGHLPSLECSIYHCQVDDMRPSARFPVVLVPTTSGLNSHLSDEIVATPFMRVRCTWKYFAGVDDVVHICDFEALLQELNIRVDMDLVMSSVGLLGRTIKEITSHNSFFRSLQAATDGAILAAQEIMYATITDSVFRTASVTSRRPVYIELFHHSCVIVNLEVHNLAS